MDFIRMSLSGAVLIVAVVIIRALTLHKLPKKTLLVLWGVAICHLLIPFSISSRFSIYTGIGMLKRAFGETTSTTFPTGMIGTGSPVESIPSTAAMVETGAATFSFSPIEIVWLTGLCACALFFIVAYIKCHREFKMCLPVTNDFTACWLREHPMRRSVQIRQSDKIKGPLTYGIFRPVVLLPKATDWTDETRLRYILTHEFVHIQRFDTLIKLLLATVLCVHWFNPFVWVMYLLANRDIELICDEKVVRTFGETTKSDYAMMLVNMEETKSRLTPLVNNFSKSSIKERITTIMIMKKTTVIGTVLALVLVMGVTTVFATTASPESSPFHREVTQETIHTTSGATIIPSSTDIGTHMDVELIKGGLFVIGRETWKKGDQIVFRINAEKDMVLYLGVLPAEELEKGFGYNGYGLFAPKEIQVGPEAQEVSFIIPKTGEYGFGVQNKNYRKKFWEKGTVTFELEINKVFENPLIK